MFTGIVQQLGSIAMIREVDFGAVLVIDPRGWGHEPHAGESIAVNGCCLTVTEPPPEAPPAALRFDVIRQTLTMTTLGSLAAGDPVNLEHAVTPSTLLGGHVVQGHIDGVATVRGLVRTDEECRMRLEPPRPLMGMIIDKGSVAVDGVSLTVAAVDDETFEVALIPTTLEITTLGSADVGHRLNVETDYIAKTVVHWLERMRPDARTT